MAHVLVRKFCVDVTERHEWQAGSVLCKQDINILAQSAVQR